VKQIMMRLTAVLDWLSANACCSST
jgi:hypothetical protein